MKFNVLGRLGTLFRYTITYACVTHCTFEYLGDFVLCKGPSMEPTLYSDNVLMTERLSKHWRKYQPGDIIIAVSPVNAEQFICKRIVAVSGERILTQKPSPIEAESAQINSTMMTDYVPRGYIWIEGDNKSNSADSRYYGPIPLGLVRSRVICRVWPLSQLSSLSI